MAAMSVEKPPIRGGFFIAPYVGEIYSVNIFTFF